MISSELLTTGMNHLQFTPLMRVGSKTADNTISYILHYLKSVSRVPSWVTRLHVFLDNAGSTNKNQLLMSSCMELVQHPVLQYFQISFMVPGHTKLVPDLLFSQIAKSYYKPVVWNRSITHSGTVQSCSHWQWRNCSDLEGESGRKIFQLTTN